MHRLKYIQTNTELKSQGRTCSFPVHHQSGIKSKNCRIFLEVTFVEVLFEFCLWSAMYNISVVFLTSEWTKILDQSFLWESLILVVGSDRLVSKCYESQTKPIFCLRKGIWAQLLLQAAFPHIMFSKQGFRTFRFSKQKGHVPETCQ